MKVLTSITPLIILIASLLILIIVFNYQIDKLGKVVESDVKTIDSLQTELFIKSTTAGRYEIFYEVMKERHPKESEGIMESIE